MNHNGHTIVLITHDAQVAAMAGRRLRMEEGQLQEQN